MLSLGYEEYVTQGGDWGHLVRRPQRHVLGGTYLNKTPFRSLVSWPVNMDISTSKRGTQICQCAFCCSQLLTINLIINLTRASPPKLLLNPYQYIVHALTPYTAEERTGLQRGVHFRATGQGYFHEQSTQPQTLGYSLADSPVGLLAWIYEKLVNWTDAYKWEDDEGVIGSPICRVIQS